MAKHLDNAVIYLLCVVIGVLFVLLAFVLLRILTVEASLKHHKREADKSALVLREEREKLEKLLKTVKPTEKGNE